MSRPLTQTLVLVVSLLGAACGPSGRIDNDANNGPFDAPPCNTSISGKVFAPNGTLPLYNVRLYVPETPPAPFVEGVQCGQCMGQESGGAITKATSDAEGKFRLDNVPPGNNVQVVITTGKWRRIVTVPVVGQCVDNPVQDGTFRLPRNRSEGDLPRIAVTTGGCDPLACILPKLGIDASEFGSSSSGLQRVVFYNGSGGIAPGTPAAAETLWSNLNELKKFDIVINSCECSEHPENKTAPDILKQYADMGGRVFGSHYHYIWTKTLIPEWQSTAVWLSGSSAAPDLVDTSHPDGQAFAKWLVAVGASATLGQITLGDKISNVQKVNPPTLRWLYSSGTPSTSHYLSFKTPVGALPENQCGKVVYAGMHVASGDVNATFPSSCSSSLTPDEKALVFLLFDLSSCVDIIF